MSDTGPGLPLRVCPEEFGIARLPGTAPIPAALLDTAPCFLARRAGELSLIAPRSRLEGLPVAPGAFRLLEITLTFGTTEVGVLRRLVDPLADAGVWILALGTHDTDCLLLRADQLGAGVAALREAGHRVEVG